MPLQQTLEEIELLAENSGAGLLGKRLVNGEAIIAKIQQLRPLLPSSPKSLQLTDELDHLVKNSKVGFLGKYIIDEEKFFTKIQQLRSAISQSSQRA